MSWIDTILNKATVEAETTPEQETIEFTFKSDGKVTPEQSREWDRGFDAGLKFCLENYTTVDGYKKEWPKDWGQGWFGHGFSEGNITGRGMISQKEFPGYQRITARIGKGKGVKIILADGSYALLPDTRDNKEKFEKELSICTDLVREALAFLKKNEDVSIYTLAPYVAKILLPHITCFCNSDYDYWHGEVISLLINPIEVSAKKLWISTDYYDQNSSI